MRIFWIVLMLLVMLTACSPMSLIPDSTPLATQEPTSTPMLTPASGLDDGILLTDTQEVVNKMRAVCCEDGWWNHLFAAEHQYDESKSNEEEFDTGAAFLENLEAAGERFDSNEYFTILSHLAPEEGRVLDYVYFAPGGDGFPRVYARQAGEQPFATYSEYEKAEVEDYLSHIQADDTAEGFYELALLSIMGEQFYLSWHAEYNDREVVSSRERLEAIIEWLNEEYAPLTEEQVEDIKQLDVSPKVKFEGDKVQVRVLVFTKWGGFYERIFTIDRNFPHQMIHEEIQLIPYNCGVMF
ncbi:hypothetical protein ACFLUA_00940 [Chloroflexota bacterium]